MFGSFPKPALLLDFKERGTDSVRDVKGLHVAKIRHSDDLEAIYWDLKDGKLDFASVCLDTVSQLQEMLSFEKTGEKDNARWGAMSRKQYGDVSSKLKTIITDFCDLDDYEVCFLAHERAFNIPDEEAGDDILLPEIGPRLMPSVRDVLNAQVGIIGQTYIRVKTVRKPNPKNPKKTIEVVKVQHCLWIAPDPVRTAKIRKPRSVVLPSFVVDPTHEDLMEIIKGEA